jgi:hypothetical protein
VKLPLQIETVEGLGWLLSACSADAEERRIWRKKEGLLPHMARAPIMFVRRSPSRSRSKRNG